MNLLKKIMLLFLLLGQLQMVVAQDKGGQFLVPAKQQSLLFVEMEEQTGFVFQLSYWMDKGGVGFTIQYIDTIGAREGSNEYWGTRTSVQKEKDRFFLTYPSQKGSQPKKIEIDTAGSYTDINYKINNAYWWTNFFKLVHDIHAQFPMLQYSFRNGFHYWDELKDQHSYYRDFRPLADEKISLLRDSIFSAELTNTRITNYILDHISTMELGAVRDSLFQLPNSYQHQYFRIAVNKISRVRPELISQLAAAAPEKKNELLSATSSKFKTQNSKPKKDQ